MKHPTSRQIWLAALLALLMVVSANVLQAITANAATIFAVTSTADAVDANPGDGICTTSAGVCTLRAAVQEANANPGADTIMLTAGLYALTLPSAAGDGGGDLDITGPLTISGAGAAVTFIDASGVDRVIEIVEGAGNITLTNLTLRNGATAEDGGAIYNASSGTLQLTGVTVRDSSSVQEGGAIHTVSGRLIVGGGSVITGNTARGGGGIYNAGELSPLGVPGRVEISNSTIADNQAATGGGVYNTLEGSLTLTAVTFSGNSADGDGGGVANAGRSALTVTRVTFTANQAGGAGGGLFSASERALTITNSTFSENQAGDPAVGDGGEGGALYTDGSGSVTVTQSTFTNNSAVAEGGAITFSSFGAVTFTDSTVSHNTAESGGGINNSGATVNFARLSIHHNEAEVDGGGLINQSSGSFTVEDSNIFANIAQNGGGMSNDADGTLYVRATTFWDNRALVGAGEESGLGGGIFSLGDAGAVYENVTISGNLAQVRGGALYIDADAGVDVVNSTLAYNSAPIGSGVADEGTNLNTPSPSTSVIFRNTIVAGNIGGTDCNFWLGSAGGNMDGGTSCGFAGPKDRQNAQPRLDAVADNGGFALTMALQPDSLAIDGGVGACPATDARGVTRPLNDRCDIGAFEYEGPFPADDINPPDTFFVAGPLDDTEATSAFLFNGIDDVTAPEDLLFECRLLEFDPTEPPVILDPTQPLPPELDFVSCSSPWIVPVIEAGTFRFEVRSIDRGDNDDPTPAVHDFEVGLDLTPPDTFFLETPTNPSGSSVVFTFGGVDDKTAERFLEFECRLDSNDPTAWLECAGIAAFGNLTPGQHTFEVRAGDLGDNVDPTPASYTWTVGTPANCNEANITLFAVEDSYIGESLPLNNFGIEFALQVASGAAGTNARSLLRFELPPGLPGCDLESATLRLYGDGDTGRTLQAIPVAAPWQQNQVTWNNQPITGGVPALTSSGGGFREWNVTDHVTAIIGGTPNHGWLIRDAEEGDLQGAGQSFRSRESINEPPTPPQLVLRFEDDGTPPPPPPPAPTPAFVFCGQTITTSTLVQNDLDGCLGEGLIIGASNIILDLNGRTIRSAIAVEPGEEDGLVAGIRNVGHDNVIIRNGTVENFGYGVRILVGATYNIVENMTLTGNVNAGVELYDADNGRIGNTVRNNIFQGNGYGLTITSGSENSLIENNQFLGNGNLAVYLYDSSGHRITGNYVSGVTNNPLLDSDGGIELESSSNNELTNNSLADTGDSGIALRAGSNRNLVQGNTASRASDGAISVDDSDYNQILDNVLHRSGGEAIGLGNANHTTVIGNDLRFNPTGLELSGSSNNRIEDNDASYSGASGIVMEGGESNEIVNNVANNTNASGIAIEASNLDANGNPTGGSLIQGNTANDNRATGISIRGVGHTITANAAYNNLGFGIAADDDNIDGGGNLAAGNAEVVDCVGVVCTPGTTTPPNSADLTAPDTAILTNPTNGSSTLDPAIFTFTGSDNLAPATALRFECRLDAPPDPTPEPPEPGDPPQPPDVDNWLECSSPISYDFLLAGEHTFEVRAIDPAANVDLTPATFTWTTVAAPPGADGIAPNTTIVSTPTNPSTSTTATFRFRGSDNSTPGPNLAYECRIDGGSFAACTSPATFSGLSLGSHTFDVRAVDLQGNADATPATYTWTIQAPPPDAIAPETTITAGPDWVTVNTSATFAFTADEEATFECALDGGSFAACTSPVTLNALAVGERTFAVRAVDLAGNVDNSPATYTWTITPAPTPTAASCGDVITQSIVLTANVSDCLEDGLIVGADNITIDLGGNTIDGTGLGSGIRNDGFTGVTVRNGTIQEFDYGVLLNPGSTRNIVELVTFSLNQISGITLLDADDGLIGNTIRNNEIAGNGMGIELYDSSGTSLRGNQMAGNAGSGLYLFASSNNRIEENFVVGSSDTAVVLEGSSNNILRGNEITGNPDGALEVTDGSNANRIEANYLAESGDAGVIIALSVNNEVVGNTVREMVDSAIVLDEVQYTLVYGNDVRFNSGGIEMSSASLNRIEANNASSSSGIGIEIGEFSEKNVILLNQTNDNDAGGIVVGGTAPAGYGNFIERNTANNNSGNGISAYGVGHIIIANQANNNAGWGIYAAEGNALGLNIDGGGNVGSGNAEPTQCYNISCDGSAPVAVDQTPPQTLISAGPANPTVFNSATFDFSGFDNATAVTFQCSLDGAAFSTCTSPVTYTGLSLGSHSFAVRSVDWSGNVDPSPATLTWTINALPAGIPPDTTLVSGPDSATPSTSATFIFSANEPGVTFQCALDGAAPTLCTSPQTYTGLTPGAHQFEVYAVDSENLPDTTPATFTWVITPAPVAAAVSCGQTLTQSTLLTNDLLDCGGDGLVIGANGITVDLNGRLIDGVGLGVGVRNNGFDNVVITNGTVQEFDYGVQLNAGSTFNVVSLLTLQQNQDGAIQLLDADNAIVRNNTATANTTGIVLDGGTSGAWIYDNFLLDIPGNAIYLIGVSGNRVEENLASGSSGAGIALEGAADNLILGNTLTGSSGGGVELSLNANNNRIEANTVTDSGSDGISLSEADGNELIRNTVHNSGGSGIALEFADNNLLSANDVSFNAGGIGLITSSNNRMEANYASAAGGGGIELEAQSLANQIVQNTVIGNSGGGIYIADAAPSGQGNLIESNNVSGNGGDGISVNGGGHTITDNLATINGGWGIYAASTGMDGGSNRAGGNAEPTQCFNIACTLVTFGGEPDTILVLRPDDPTNSSSAIFTFTGVDNTTQPFDLGFECRLDSSDPLAWVECENPWILSNLSQGEHTFEVRAIDADGNVDPTPATYTWLYTALPLGVAPDTFINRAPPLQAPLFEGFFTFSSNEPDVTFECSLDGAAFAPCGFENPETPVSTGVFEYAFEEFEVGPHSFQVRAVDIEGIVDPTPATYNWTITGIVVTVTSGPAYIAPGEPGEPAEGGETEETNATFTFVANLPDATFQCSLDLAPFVPCTSGISYSGLAVGEHIFRVFATDLEGNVQLEPTEYGWSIIPALDTNAPNTFITTTDPVDANGSLTFAFIGIDDVTSPAALIFECSLNDPTDAGFGACTSPLTLPNPELPEPLAPGVYTLYVRALDVEANVDATPAALEFTYLGDAIAPLTTISAAPAATTLLEEVTVAFSANDPFASFECSLDGVLFAPCSSPATVQTDLSAAYTFQVRAIDLNGNVGASATANWIFVGAPQTVITAAPAATTAAATATFIFNADQPGATSTFVCALDAGPFLPCGSGVTFSGLADGSHTFRVQATNSFGLVEAEPVSYVWSISGAPADVTPPDTVIQSGPDPITLNTSATFTFASSDPGAGFRCSLDGASLVDCTTPYEVTQLAIGVHTLEVAAIDFAGNVDPTPAFFTWEVDGPPLSDITSAPAEVTESTSATFTFVADDPTSTFQCWLDGVISPCTSPVTYTGLALGAHTFGVLATDAAGNVQLAYEEHNWTILASTPPQTTLSAWPAAFTEETIATFEFTGSDNASQPDALTFQCRLDSTLEADFVACTSPQSYNGLAVGPHTFEVRAVDEVGNVDATPATFTWTVTAPVAPNTPVGSNVAVNLTSPEGPATVTFDSVNTAGNTTVNVESNPPALPAGYLQLGALFYDISTTAGFSGNVEICLSYAPADFANPAALQLFHFEGGNWVDVTTSNDSVSGLICGAVTSLSPFAIAQPVPVPDTSLTGTPDAETIDTTAVFAFASDQAGATFECSRDGSAFAACVSPVEYTGMTVGSHTFTVRAVYLGVVDPTPAVYNWTILTPPDTTAPETSFTATPAASTLETTASFAFTASEPGATFQCSLNGAAFAACTSPVNFTALTPGAYEFAVRAVDAAGNVDATPATHIWVVVTPADCGPEVISFADADAWIDQNSSTSNKGTDSILKVQAKAPSDNFRALVRFPLPATLPAGCQVQTATLRLFAASAINGRTLEALRITGAWTEGNVTWSNQPATTGPVVTTLSNQGWVEWDIAAHVQAIFNGRPNQGFLIRDAVEGGNGFEQQFHGREKGENVPMLVITYAPNGNNQDITPPQTTLALRPEAATVETNASFTFTTDEAGAVFQCSLDGAAFAACAAPVQLTNLAVGAHSFAVRAVDAAGLVDPTPARFTWTVTPPPDVTAPQTTIESGPATNTIDTSATFVFSANEAGSIFACALDGGAFSLCASPKEYTGLTVGVHTFQVRAADQAGNVETTAVSYTWSVHATPETNISAAPDATTTSTEAIFTFTADKPESSFQCALDGAAFSACAASTTFSNLAVGEHTLSVRAVDLLGYIDPTPATYTWTILPPPDTTAPETTITSTPAATTLETSATFAFAANEEASTFTCSLDGAAFAPCASPVTFDSLAVGTHTFAIRATDPANNSDPTPATFTWTVEAPPPPDTTAPETTITASPATVTLETSAAFSFSADEAGSTFACSLNGAAFTACVSPVTFDGLTVGVQSFAVEATDAAGNTDASPATFTWTVEAPPVAPEVTVTAQPESSTTATSATFEFVSNVAEVAFECALDGAAFTACASPAQFDGLSVGSHTFQVRAAPSAANPEPAITSVTWTIVPPPDTTAPQTTIQSGPEANTISGSATFVFTVNEAVMGFECALNGAPLAACTSPQEFTGLAAGAYTFQVRAIDLAGNVETPVAYTWTVHALPETIISVGPDATTTSTSATFTFSASKDGSIFVCALDGAVFTACASPQTFANLAVGVHTFSVQATDALGYVDPTPATYTWTILPPPDTTAPQTTLVSGPATSTAEKNATFTFAADEAATFECALDGAAFVGCTSPVSHNNLSLGQHTFAVRATDAAGNVDPTPATLTWTILPPPDTTAPETAILSGPPATTALFTATFTFAANETGSIFVCSLDGAPFTACASPRDLASLSAGAHTFQVAAIDAAGNIDPTPAVYTWTVAPPPNCGSQIIASVAADAWIDQNSSGNNMGSDSILKVQAKGPRDNFRALVRFNMPTPPAGCVVQSATLRLFAASWKNGRTLQAIRVTGSWTENGVRWNNQPATTGPAATTSSGSNWREWNVTGQVQSIYTSGVNQGFLIRDATEGGNGFEQQFHAKEKQQNVPMLLITFAAAGQ